MSDRNSSRRGIRVVSALLAVAGFACAAHADEYSVLARTSMPSPYGSGATFSRFISNGYELARPMLAQSGDVCFQSVLSGPAVPADTALVVISGLPSQLNPIWRQGTQATGLPQGINFAGLSSLQINALGDVAYIASLTGAGIQYGVNDRGVWTGNSLGTMCLARDGSPLSVAGYPNASMDWLTSVKVSAPEAFGPVVLSGRVNGTGLGSGLQCALQQTASGFTVAMLGNTQLPNAGPGTLILATTPIVGREGIGAYQTTLTGSGVSTVTVNGIPILTDKAITAGLGAQLRTVARAGFQAPTEPTGVTFWQVWGGSARLVVNGDGDLAFSASMAGPGVAGGNEWGIWLDRAGQLSRIMRLSDAAPVAGTTIGALGLYSGASFISLADNDAVVFTAMIMGGGANSANNGTIIHSHNGARTLVARGGVSHTSLPSGVRMQNTNFGLGARVGTGGHVALAAKLEGTGVISSNDAAVFLWAPDDTQGLRLVCREGDVIGQYRITTLSQTGADLHVNSTGQIVFTATVVDINDSMQASRTAIIAAAPDQPAWVVAVEGGSLALSSGTSQVRTVRMGATGAFNDSGDVAFVVDLGTSTTPDEAVVVAQLSGPSVNPCPADYNASGDLTVNDIYAFLTDWFRGDADYDHSGATEVIDIFIFLRDWYHGCD